MDISSNISVVTIENLIEDFVTIIPADFSLILKISGLFREKKHSGRICFLPKHTK